VPVAAILDLLAAGGAGDRQEPLLALVAARLPADADAVLLRLATVPAAVARALAKAIGARAPARIGEATLALLGHEDAGLQLDALRAAGALPGGVPPAALAAKLLSSSEAVRIAAARALERHGGTATARAVAEALTSRRSFSRDEATALGRTLAILHPPTALRHFEAWLPERRGLLDRLKSGEHEELLRWAAAAGLAAMPGPEAERRLEAAAAGSDDELRRYCRAALARRSTTEGGRRG
jgi:hypothetical protein